MHTCTIRPATPHDALALAELAALTFAQTYAAENRAQDMEAHLRAAFGQQQQASELADPQVRTLLACCQQELVGFAQLRRAEAPACVQAAQPVELHRFYLTRAVQGTGLATRLMQAARAAALELEGRHLWLGVWQRNTRAMAFYAKSGFVPVGSHDFMVGSDRQTDRVLVSPLRLPG